MPRTEHRPHAAATLTLTSFSSPSVALIVLQSEPNTSVVWAARPVVQTEILLYATPYEGNCSGRRRPTVGLRLVETI
jgi:hypothetical protein